MGTEAGSAKDAALPDLLFSILLSIDNQNAANDEILGVLGEISVHHPNLKNAAERVLEATRKCRLDQGELMIKMKSYLSV
jgi:hypothetical protein